METEVLQFTAFNGARLCAISDMVNICFNSRANCKKAIPQNMRPKGANESIINRYYNRLHDNAILAKFGQISSP